MKFGNLNIEEEAINVSKIWVEKNKQLTYFQNFLLIGVLFYSLYKFVDNPVKDFFLILESHKRKVRGKYMGS